MCRTLPASSARLRVPLLGYEGNPGADAVQENPTKPAKIQQIGGFELGGFGSSRTAFSHRRGIAALLRLDHKSNASRKTRGEPYRYKAKGALLLSFAWMKPWEYPPPQFLFKYLPPERVHVLKDCRVRFSQRTAFDDDHELQPDYATFGTSDEIWRFAISTGSQLSRAGLPASVIVEALSTNRRAQERAIATLHRTTTVKDELGCFCLTEVPDSERMWREYADHGKGFVLGFDTSHPGFVQQLMPRGKLGKISYSDEPFGSALGAMEDEGVGVMFRKRLKYSCESEWRIIRLLKRLEHNGDGVFLSAFDSGSISRILMRPACSVEPELRSVIASDQRYRNVRIEEQDDTPIVNTPH
jgi:hypothetical protein